jgi:hypothetical protein
MYDGTIYIAASRKPRSMRWQATSSTNGLSQAPPTSCARGQPFRKIVAGKENYDNLSRRRREVR